MLRALREIAHNVKEGKLPLTAKQLSNLKKHKTSVRLLANKKASDKTRFKVAQKGGFIASLLAPLLAGLIGPTVNSLTGGALSGR